MTEPTLPAVDPPHTGLEAAHHALHDLNVRIAGLAGDCHCNLVAEVAIRAAAPHIEADALLRAAEHFREAQGLMVLKNDWADGYREALRGVEANLRDRAANVQGGGDG